MVNKPFRALASLLRSRGPVRLTSPALNASALPRAGLALGLLAIALGVAGGVYARSRPPRPLAAATPSATAALSAEGLRGQAELAQPGYLVSRGASSRGERPTATLALTAVPTSLPAATPTAAAMKAISYRVAAGDTVAALAERFGISAETILWANDLDAGATLQPGQELTILPVSGVLHTVRKGDTLNGIAEHYGVEPATIIAANSVASPDALSIDQTLIIPGGRPLPPPTPVPAAPLAPEATSAPVSAEATGKGAEIVAIAQRYLGYAYVYGGASPAAGFDCSGFTQYVYGQAGLSIARGLSGQLAAGPSVSRSELLPGDLVFFQGTYQAGLSHVGIYVGDGMMIHASSPERGVCYDDLDATYWVQHYYGACRAW